MERYEVLFLLWSLLISKLEYKYGSMNINGVGNFCGNGLFSLDHFNIKSSLSLCFDIDQNSCMRQSTNLI